MAKQKTLKDTYLVTKHNALNEMRANDMTMQELRLFSVYLSRIDPKNPETRNVRFPLAEFNAIMELKRENVAYYKKVARSLLGKIIELHTKYGGYDAFTLFSRFRLDQEKEMGEWYVDIIANDHAMPLLFEFKSNYFKYELWNALHLKGPNQLRMYEILKQYEKSGHRIVSIVDLRIWLGIKEMEYPKYADFRRHVLEPCKKAISENTDITFAYEPHKKGARGKILELKFIIKKNTDHKDPLSLREFVKLNSGNVIGAQLNLNEIDSFGALELEHEGNISKRDLALVDLREMMNNEFTIEQVDELYSKAIEALPNLSMRGGLELHFQKQYKYAKRIESQGDIKKSVFSLLRSIIDKA